MESAHSKKYIEQKTLKEIGVSIPFIVGGLTAAAIIGTIDTMFEKKKLYCDKLTDPLARNQCLLAVIDSYITNLKESKKECEMTSDPAQCNLDILNKIDKLLYKKEIITKRIDKEFRLKNQKEQM